MRASLGRPLRLGAAIPVDPLRRASLVSIAPAALSFVALCRELGAATGLDVDPASFDAYADLYAAIDRGEIDLAWLPPIPALQTVRRGTMTPLVSPVRAGVTSFGSALFAREESRVKNLIDLDRVRAAWVDEQSAAGYVVIRAALRARGIDLRAAFGQEIFFGSHEAVVEAVLSGDVDVGATYAHFSPERAGVARAGWGDRRARIVALAGPIPADLLAAATSLPYAVRAAVVEALVAHPTANAAALALLDAEAVVAARPEHVEALSALAPHLEGEDSSASTLPPPPA